jgi:hypothetical protein
VDAPEGAIGSIRDFVGWLSLAPEPIVALALYGATLASLVAIIAGFAPRFFFSAYTALYLHHYLAYLHGYAASYDRVMIIISAIMSAAPSAGSIRRGGAENQRVSLWTQKLIMVQVAILHLGTGVFKFTATSWSDGHIIVQSMIGDLATPLSFWIMRLAPPRLVFDFLASGSAIWEIAMAGMLFHPRTRKFAFVSGTLFHAGIALLLSLWQFLFVPITYVLFLDSLQEKTEDSMLSYS